MTANMENCRMAKVMAKEGRVTTLLSISTKGEDIVESKRRWKEVFLQSTGGKECLLVVARGGADFFQYLIHQVRILSNMLSTRSEFCQDLIKQVNQKKIKTEGCETFFPLRCGRVRNVETP